MAKQKRHLTAQQEFEIMKIVLDKFLLLGTIIMAIGLYMIVTNVENFALSFAVLMVGLIIFIIFAVILVKEYHFLKN